MLVNYIAKCTLKSGEMQIFRVLFRKKIRIARPGESIVAFSLIILSGESECLAAISDQKKLRHYTLENCCFYLNE